MPPPLPSSSRPPTGLDQHQIAPPPQEENAATMQHPQAEYEVEVVYSVPDKVVHHFLDPWGRRTYSKTAA